MRAYLDNNATTRVAPEVRDAMMPLLDEQWGNPSSPYRLGRRARQYVEKAREQVARLIGADPAEIIFTSGGSESNNTAIRGVIEAAGGRGHIVTTSVEHSSVLAVCRYLGRRGCRLTELRVDSQGRLDLDHLADSLHDGPAIVSIMWANNETGVIFPLDEVARIVKRAGCVLHTDAVQAAGKTIIDVAKVPVDLLSISGHKFHGPKGIGALYVRRGTRLNPLILGGHQEADRRAGTENVPAIVGLGRACELAAEHMATEMPRIAALRDRLEAGILASCPDVTIIGDRRNRLPNTLGVLFRALEGDAIVRMLDEVGIAVSTGSACDTGSVEPSHVLRAMGVPLAEAGGSIRFSLSRYTTPAEIDYVLEQLPPIVQRLREISPLVGK